eukprot:scaffold20.g7842.t1
MADRRALHNIEADIQFCEDVLNYKGQLPSGRDRADLHRAVQRSSSTGRTGDAAASTSTASWPAAPAARMLQAGQQHERMPASRHEKQQQRGWQAQAGEQSPKQRQRQYAGQPASPPQQQQQQQQQQQAVKPRNIEELWAVLESAPTGQPVEIDAGLLYGEASSEPSCADDRASQASLAASPAASSRGGGRGARWQAGDDFLLHAYRPDGGEQRNSLEFLPSPASSTGRRGKQKAMHQAPHSPTRPAAWHASGSGTGRGGRRPGSAPQPWQRYEQLAELEDEVDAPSTSGRSSRQVSVEEVRGASARGSPARLAWRSQQERLEELAQPRTHLWQRCAAQQAKQAREELEECTFAPRTGRPPSRSRLPPGVPVEERLLAAREGKAQALERARQEQASAEAAECTFAPQLVADPQRHLRAEHRPIHQRLAEEHRQKSAKLAQARMREVGCGAGGSARAMPPACSPRVSTPSFHLDVCLLSLVQDLANPELTFQPELNPRSLAIAAAKEGREMFSPRAAGRPGSARAGGRRPGSAGAASPERGCTFSPAINSASKQLVEDSTTLPADFQQRQRFYSQRRQAAAQRAAASAGADACTFSPDTGNAVEVLAQSAQAAHLLESSEQRCQRMGWEEAERLRARRAAKEAEVYGGMDFKPQLNQQSLLIGKSHGVEGLASAERQRARLKELRAAEEARRLADCTFQPDTSKPRVLGYYAEYEPPAPAAPLSIAEAARQGFEGLTERIAGYRAEREARAAEARRAAEAAQLSECTFSPAINRGRSAARAPSAVVVPGLNRFLELKQLAERQRTEQEERAARVFNASPAGGALAQGHRVTVPRPFRLAGQALLEAKAQQKQAQLLQDVQAERLRDCTFQPQTNTGQRRATLDRLLAQPSYSEELPANL